jgi:hypothetical protein
MAAANQAILTSIIITMILLAISIIADTDLAKRIQRPWGVLRAVSRSFRRGIFIRL